MATATAHACEVVADFEASSVSVIVRPAAVVGAWEEEGEDGGRH